MAVRKIEVNEDDLKKVILILKLSRKYLQIPSGNLALSNMWRVAEKLADKLMRKAELTMITAKGRNVLKPIKGVNSEVVEESTPTEEKSAVLRCRKRKKLTYGS